MTGMEPRAGLETSPPTSEPTKDESLLILSDMAAEIESEFDATAAELHAVEQARLTELGVDVGIVERELREHVAALAWCERQLRRLRTDAPVRLS
ncbi:MAG: hypothetical protein HY329_23250 [Chloroflexi bacterium]|nr:hypothetical protein [Chloroflexota bacterium]